MIELPARRGKDDAASLLESADAAASDEPREPSPWACVASRLATPLLPDAGGARGRLANFLGLSYALLLGARSDSVWLHGGGSAARGAAQVPRPQDALNGPHRRGRRLQRLLVRGGGVLKAVEHDE